jgi:hypothetical protein
MSVPNQPFYVSFQTDKVPLGIDHTRSSPGPNTGSSDRAGHTSFRPRTRVSFAWDNGPAQADGLVPFYALSVNAYFRLDDFIVSISSDYPVGSCSYEATRQHEFESHIARPMRIFHRYRDILIMRLNMIQIPTQRSLILIRLPDIPALQNSLQQRVIEAVGSVRQDLVRELNADRQAQDSPASYRIIYNQCSNEDWARGSSR